MPSSNVFKNFLEIAEKGNIITIEEAIRKIKISGGAMALSVITVEKDGKTITKLFNARQTNGVFGQGSPSFQAIHLKGVKARLGL